VVTELVIVGGDPALDLVNTLGDDRVADPLGDYESFARWAAQIEVIDDEVARRLAARAAERPAAARRALTEARSLRGVLDAVFRPLATAHEPPPEGGPPATAHDPPPEGGPPATAHDPPPDALAELVRLAGAAVERGRLVPADGGFALAWSSDHLARPLWPIAAAGVDLLRAGPLDRLQQCAGCPWLFLDTSRNRSRRWCSMSVCGANSKMRRYRARLATEGR
jgi:predicted RNA-binding Zn ribbon-like protein